MVAMAFGQQVGIIRKRHCCSEFSRWLMTSNLMLVLLLTINLVGYCGNCLDLEKQQSGQKNNIYNENYDKQEQQQASVVKRSIYSDGDSLVMPVTRQQVLKERSSLRSTRFQDRDQLVDNDHELPADYYYYQLQQQQPIVNSAGVSFGDATMMDDNQQRNSNNNQYRDYSTIVYPDGDQGSPDLEKRPDWYTTRSTLEGDSHISSPIKSAIYKLLYSSPVTDDHQEPVLGNEGQRGKRRGSSSCNFNSGLTSKCDNMDYIQAWNHHNWFHKKTLPG